MNNDGVIPSIIKILETKTIYSIVLPANPSHDAVSAAVALYLALIKIGKSASIACSTPVDAALGISGSDKIQKELVVSGDNLVVSFPYEDGAIDKITYNIEGNQFNLVIAPKEGKARLETSNVKYSYKGGKGEVIFTIDAPSLASLGDIYTNQKDMFTGVEIINVDRHLTNGNFGSINLVEKQRSSTSELVFALLNALSLEIDKDSATTLYGGIVAATNNFTSYSVNANTFEACSKLLSLGAVKRAPVRAPMNPYQQPGMPQAFSNDPFAQMPRPVAQPVQPVQPPRQPVQAPPAFNEAISVAPETMENAEMDDNDASSTEWLKPKIFKGGGLV